MQQLDNQNSHRNSASQSAYVSFTTFGSGSCLFCLCMFLSLPCISLSSPCRCISCCFSSLYVSLIFLLSSLTHQFSSIFPLSLRGFHVFESLKCNKVQSSGRHCKLFSIAIAQSQKQPRYFLYCDGPAITHCHLVVAKVDKVHYLFTK